MSKSAFQKVWKGVHGIDRGGAMGCRGKMGVHSAGALVALATVLAVGGGAYADPSSADASMPDAAVSSAVIPGAAWTLDGTGYLTGFSASMPQDHDMQRGSASFTVGSAFDYTFASGTKVSLIGSFYPYHDQYTADNYDSDVFQKAFARVEGEFGALEVGMTDGAAFAMAITGPVVNDETSTESHNVTFFPDPTGGLLIDHLALNSAVEASFNYAKFAYYSPDFDGFRFGVSFAPGEGKDVVPYLANGPRVENRQTNIWELGANYAVKFGAWDVGLYGGIGFSHVAAAWKTDGHEGLVDWAAGGEAAYAFSDTRILSFGGAYHASNAYGFDIDNALTVGQSSSAHASAKWQEGDFNFGVEYSFGIAKAVGVEPTVDMQGFGAAIGYTICPYADATLGWQHLHYKRNDAAFYTGGRKIDADAVFLHLRLNASKTLEF